jgi:hypothetical protein
MQLLSAGPADASRRSGDKCPPASIAHGCSHLPADLDSPADKPVTESYPGTTPSQQNNATRQYRPGFLDGFLAKTRLHPAPS